MTPTEQDKELFELCKQVYKATSWGRMDNGSPTDGYYAANPVSIRLNKPDVIKGWQIWRWEDFGESGRLHFSLGKGQAYPLYTSDYLLEKLPKSLNRYGLFELAPTRAETMWSAGYWTNDRLETFSVIGDTPLKALLKLTLNLHEEGLL